MSTPQNETLKRTLGMREAVTITVGTVVGVGLFTTGAQIVGSMGSAVILATFMAMVISVYPSHLYAEMSAAPPVRRRHVQIRAARTRKGRRYAGRLELHRIARRRHLR